MPPRRPLGFVVIALSIMALLFFMMTPETSSLQVSELKDLATKYQPLKGASGASGAPEAVPALDPQPEVPAKISDAHIGDLPGEPAAHDAHQGDARVAKPDHKEHKEPEQKEAKTHAETKNDNDLSSDLVDGKPIMSKMTNQTARAQLGNAGWKLLHTILAQYPEKPDADARQTLETYLKLFSRVYPCRECAEHFQQLLADYPPQLSSRKTAVMWGCEAHNKVNRRLGKEIFDCAYISDKYDCGCGDSDVEDVVDPNENKPKPVAPESPESHDTKEITPAHDNYSNDHAGHADHAGHLDAAVEKEVDFVKGG